MFDLMNINYDNICAVAAADTGNKPLTMAEIKRDYADVFEGYGKLEGKVSLKVDESVQPVRMPLRKLSIPIRERVAKNTAPRSKWYNSSSDQTYTLDFVFSRHDQGNGGFARLH